MNGPKHIYALVDDTGAWRYIGCSTQPTARLSQYQHQTPRCTPLHHWLATLRVKPRILILETVPNDRNWSMVERAWIKRAFAAGQPLLNLWHSPDWDRACVTPRAPEAPLPGWFRARRV